MQNSDGIEQSRKEGVEASSPAKRNQERTGSQKPELRVLPASVSQDVIPELCLFSLWWR